VVAYFWKTVKEAELAPDCEYPSETNRVRFWPNQASHDCNYEALSMELRLLRGEELDALSRELGAAASTSAGWMEAFLSAGRSGLKSRESVVKRTREIGGKCFCELSQTGRRRSESCLSLSTGQCNTYSLDTLTPSQS
jgi:hypothetical protein